jgi:hypothetical protein
LLNWTVLDFPGAIPLVSKLPALVAVWVVLLVLEKETRAPRLTFSVPGLKAKLTIVTPFEALAAAVGSAAAARGEAGDRERGEDDEDQERGSLR